MDNHKVNMRMIKALLILIALLIALMLNSCMTYKKAKARYAHSTTDTFRISKEVILKIPKDSVQYRFITDTIPFYDEVRQGRATLRVEYKDKIVKIKADCDSVSKTETVTLKAPQEINTWGVSPVYEKSVYVLSTLLFCAVLYLVINQKKNNGTS